MEYAEIHKLIREEIKEASKPIEESYGRILIELKENKDILTEVRLQTTKTNGRVTRLEELKSQHGENIVQLGNEVKHLNDIKTQIKGGGFLLNKITVIIVGLISISGTIISIVQAFK